jgi:hypothetical protein
MNEKGRVATRLACVGVVVCVMFPLGEMMFPAMTEAIGEFPFTAIEAVVSATLGFGLFEVLFG